MKEPRRSGNTFIYPHPEAKRLEWRRQADGRRRFFPNKFAWKMLPLIVFRLKTRMTSKAALMGVHIFMNEDTTERNTMRGCTVCGAESHVAASETDQCKNCGCRRASGCLGGTQHLL